MTLVPRELVRIELTIILDFLNASTVGDAVRPHGTRLGAARLKFTLKHDRLEKYPL